jgi:hypothetical protein
MSPGQRVQSRLGYVQIISFNRSQSEGNSVYRVDFTIYNARQETLEIYLPDYIRLVVDGLPRAPNEVCKSGYSRGEMTLTVRPDSAEDCFATFRTSGQAHSVLVRFNTDPAGGHGYLRWPE